MLTAKKDYDQFSFFTDVYEFSDTRRESNQGFHKNTLKLENLFLCVFFLVLFKRADSISRFVHSVCGAG